MQAEIESWIEGRTIGFNIRGDRAAVADALDTIQSFAESKGLKLTGADTGAQRMLAERAARRKIVTCGPGVQHPGCAHERGGDGMRRMIEQRDQTRTLALRRMTESAGAALGKMLSDGIALNEAVLLRPDLKQRLLAEELPPHTEFELFQDWLDLRALQISEGGKLSLSEARKLLFQDQDVYLRARREETVHKHNPLGTEAEKVRKRRARLARERAGLGPDDDD